jgi:peptidoglycan-associated lipoprotein
MNWRNDMRKLRMACLGLALGVLLAACSGSPVDEQAPAGVEDRTATPAQTGPSTGTIPKVDVTGKSIQGVDPAVKTGVLAQRSIFYDLDQYDIKDQYKPLVEAHAKYLRDNPGRKMLIQGNTDERGGREYNIALGQRRSDGVKRMMQLLGVREDQIESVSLGEEKPRDEGHDEQAWSKNRRSDLLHQGEF